MFDKNSEELIHWFENLENRCQKLIFERRDTLFQNSLEETDIETAFNSTIRIYKSGKFYLLRTNIKNNHNNLPTIKIYDEQEIPLTMDDIKAETNIISILEIQGIKFTSRNFQIEIDLKQVMVLDNEPIFESCLIKTNKKQLDHSNEVKEELKTLENIKIDEFNLDDPKNDIENNVLDLNNDDNLEEVKQSEEIINENNLEELETFNIAKDEHETEQKETQQKENEQKEDNISFDLEIEDLSEDIEENNDELKEVNNLDLSLENNLETMQLKKPNQVYFELYKEARNKAKLAKKNALLAYLEAKNIKKTYMLENLNDNSDSDIDAEIDDVSESELEGL
jgi:hypothetical protein